MFIVRHLVIRINKNKMIKKIIFETREGAISYIKELRPHETLLLYKECQRVQERRIRR